MSEEFRRESGSAMRLFFPDLEMMEKENIEALKKVNETLNDEGFEIHVWIAIPCSPWCTWQRVNLAVIEGFKNILTKKRQESLELREGVNDVVSEGKRTFYFE